MRVEREVQEVLFELLPDLLFRLRPRYRLIISHRLQHTLGHALRKMGEIRLLERIGRHDSQIDIAQFVEIMLLERKHYQVYIIANKLVMLLQIVYGLSADNTEAADATAGL